MNADNNNPRLAVLIDADNARASIIEELLAEIANLGTANIKRIYGDWTEPNLGSWKETLLKHSIQPIQQFRNTVRKNATDSAMIIDAMDLLYTAPLDGFCIISSDSDFTRLAARIRESGKLAYGFGEKKTPEPFRKACNRFIYTENLISKELVEEIRILTSPEEVSKQEFSSSQTSNKLATPITIEAKKLIPNSLKKRSKEELLKDSKLINLFKSAIEAASGDDEWANLGGIGSNIVKKAPDFDARTYGYGKLSDLAKAIGIFDIKSQNKHIMLRVKK
ncbi:MAG: NYN domain-containing protein [Methylophilaceae bacterium]|nr:NYN domain-containing protein [Methylophilaceae bacterium]